MIFISYFAIVNLTKQNLFQMVGKSTSSTDTYFINIRLALLAFRPRGYPMHH